MLIIGHGNRPGWRYGVLWALVVCGVTQVLAGSEKEPGEEILNVANPGELSEIEVIDWRVANTEGVSTFSSPISGLRLEPGLDLQARNLAEAQADVAIRGGIFEGTALRVGSAVIPDPQTGHYTAELPLAPEMLGGLQILTGVDHAQYGAQATAGTLAYGLSGIDNRKQIRLGVGGHDTWLAESYTGWKARPGGDAEGWAADLGLAASSSDGTRPGGEHRFERLAGRVRYDHGAGRTQLVAGYQSKYFSWPYLYALEPLHNLVGSSGVESESLQTTLFLVDHRQEFAEGYWNATAFYRRNRDDYEFDVANPGLFNPFEHETEVAGFALDGMIRRGRWQLETQGNWMADTIESTALTFGEFQSRTYVGVSLLPGLVLLEKEDRKLLAQAGGRVDWTNRDGAAGSAMVRLIGERETAGGSLRWHASYSGATRVPGYTAIAGNPNGGLFRGNPDLGRERSHTWETGFGWMKQNLDLAATLFHRRDVDLVDWVFNSQVLPSFARAAENVDIDTTGLDLRAAWRVGGLEFLANYGWLSKSGDYGRSDVDASFYALNFPEHRVVFSLVAPLPERIDFRLDTEWRTQEDNPLRNGQDDATFLHLSIGWTAETFPVSLRLAADNLLDDDFEDVPGVPGSGRQVTLLARFSL